MRQGMSYAEAGRLGALKVRDVVHSKHLDCVDRYMDNPHLCKNCRKVIEYKKRKNMFCSHNCSAIYSNKKHLDDAVEKGKMVHKDGHYYFLKECLFCHKHFATRNSKAKFCSNYCDVSYRKQSMISRIEKKGYFDVSHGKSCQGETNRKYVKKYLSNKYGYYCAICGISEWNGKPISLVVDHIDGNPLNNKIDNFRLVCPNCDSQLPTYKGRNKGKGRKWRRIYTQK